MKVVPSEEDIKEREEVWRDIGWWMDKRGLTPEELGKRAKFSPKLIERGISGEPIPVRHALHNFVEALGLQSASRAKSYEDTVDVLSDQECRKLLKSPPVKTQPQSSLWDYADGGTQ